MDSGHLAARIAEELGSTVDGATSMAPTPTPRVPDHTLVRRIGAGSYGEVWLARSVTGQWRAVKVVARARFSSERPFEREFRGVVKFEPISRSHAGLIQVLHVGRDDAVGAFYYVMELADPEPSTSEPTSDIAVAASPENALESAAYTPRTLRSELVSRGRLPVLEVVTLGVQLCGALGHLHRHGLVHRDVKPSNVIYVQGLPRLADLGLVSTTGEARSFVGTEGFIPPEGPGTEKADLFALGRLLYEAATGKDRCSFPELPQDLERWNDREQFLELNEVLARLCEPQASRRIANAAEAAGDLNLILAGRSVRRAYGVERQLRWATRVAVAALAVLLGAAVWVGFQEQRQREEEARTAAERVLRQRAQSAEAESRRQLYTALLEQARATVRSGEMGQRLRALDAIRRAARMRNTPELRREAIAALALPDLRPDRDQPWGAQYSVREPDPEFQRIALCDGRGPIEIRTVGEGTLQATLPASTNLPCYNVGWSVDGRYLSAKRDIDNASGRSDLEIWDLRGAARLVRVIPGIHGDIRAHHPQLPLLFTTDAEGWITTWDLERNTALTRRRYLDSAPELLCFSPRGDRMALLRTVGNGSSLSIHRLADGSTESVRAFNGEYVAALAWHPKADCLALTDHAGGVRILELNTGALHLLGRHRAQAVFACFSPRGDYLFTGGWERSLLCWDLLTRQKAMVLELDTYLLRFRADRNECAVLKPESLQFHTFETPFQRRFGEDLGSRLRYAAFSPDGRWLAGSADAGLGVWDLAKDAPGWVSEEAGQSYVSWSSDAQDLVGCRGQDGAFHWRVGPSAEEGAPPILVRQELSLPPGFAWLTILSNRFGWTAGRGFQLTLPNQVAPEEDAWRPTQTGLSFISPKQRWVAIYRGYSRLLHVYKLPEIVHVATLTNAAPIGGFQFTPDDEEIVVASRGQMEFWSTRTWEKSRTLAPFAGIPGPGVLMHPGGKGGLWMAREQRFASLYKAGTFDEELPLPSALTPLAVSADGRQLAVAAELRHLQVWDLERLRVELDRLGLSGW